jgi:hypothetical protein
MLVDIHEQLITNDNEAILVAPLYDQLILPLRSITFSLVIPVLNGGAVLYRDKLT